MLFFRKTNNISILSLLEALSISMSSKFGITVIDANDFGTKNSARFALFVIFIVSSVLFYVYGGFIFSSLAVPSDYEPFKSPEGILQTNYR